MNKQKSKKSFIDTIKNTFNYSPSKDDIRERYNRSMSEYLKTTEKYVQYDSSSSSSSSS